MLSSGSATLLKLSTTTIDAPRPTQSPSRLRGGSVAVTGRSRDTGRRCTNWLRRTPRNYVRRCRFVERPDVRCWWRGWVRLPCLAGRRLPPEFALCRHHGFWNDGTGRKVHSYRAVRSEIPHGGAASHLTELNILWGDRRRQHGERAASDEASPRRGESSSRELTGRVLVGRSGGSCVDDYASA
jgi:hypothetical protein